MDKVVEPSEIILETKEKKEEQVSSVDPWTRFVARFFDYSLFCLLILFVQKISGFHFKKYDHFIPFEFFLWIPLETFLLVTLGTTPGKFFLRTRLKVGIRKRAPFLLALKRSFKVWFRGMGLGITGINFFCLAVAYQKLMVMKTTSWDREDHVQVIHLPKGKWRMYVAVFVAAAGFLFYREEKGKELRYAHRPLHEHSSQKISSVRKDLSSPNCCYCRGY